MYFSLLLVILLITAFVFVGSSLLDYSKDSHPDELSSWYRKGDMDVLDC